MPETPSGGGVLKEVGGCRAIAGSENGRCQGAEACLAQQQGQRVRAVEMGFECGVGGGVSLQGLEVMLRTHECYSEPSRSLWGSPSVF